MIGLVTATSDLPDGVAQSLFHALRHEARGLPPNGYVHSAEQIREQLAVQIAAAEVKPQRREGLRRRLAAAQGEDLPVDVRYAAMRFRERASHQVWCLQNRLSSIAEGSRRPVAEVRARFDELREAAPPGRKPRLDPLERMWLGGLSGDPATRHALHQLEAEASAGVTVAGKPARVRCGRCGQYAGAVHHCPAVALHAAADWSAAWGVAPPLVDLVGARARLRTADPARVAERLAEDPGRPVTVPVGAEVAADWTLEVSPAEGEVRGEAGVLVDAAGQLGVVSRSLRCYTCHSAPPCRHLNETLDELRGALQAARSVDAAAVGAAAAGLQPPPRFVPAPLSPDLSTFRYTEDVELFVEHVRAARADDDEGVDPIGYLHAQAVYGYGQGRAFGVELEYDLDEWQAEEWGAEQLGERLFAQGLTQQEEMREYHAAQIRGYTFDEDGWSLEEESTAGGGELVSPVLADNAVSWRNLDLACRTIRRHGGVASERTGGHVHVSAPEYVGSAARVSRLVSMVTHYEDTIGELADAGRGRDRGEYAAPMGVPPALGYLTVGEALAQQDRNRTVNLEAVAFPPDGIRVEAHLEFRCWDGSLSPSRIQAQIKLSLALADYAARHPDEPAAPVPPHRSRAASDDPGAVEIEALTQPIRTLIDLLFRRDSDKRQIAALWAVASRPAY